MARVFEEEKLYNLTEFESKLLGSLFLQEQFNLSKIAKQLATSKERIFYNLKHLEKETVLKGLVGIADGKLIGFDTHILYVRLQSFDLIIEKRLLKFFSKSDVVKTVGLCTGNWDLYIVFCSRNSNELGKTIKEFKNVIGKNLLSTKFATFSTEKFKAFQYLHAKEFTKQKVQEKVELNGQDLTLLREFSLNPRLKSIELAKKASFTPQTVSQKLKKFFSNGVIKSINPLINISKLGMQWYVISLSFSQWNDKLGDELKEFLGKSDMVVFFGEVIGQWDFELDLHVKSSRELHKFLQSLRQRFKGLILNFETTLIFEDVKFDMMPKAFTPPELKI